MNRNTVIYLGLGVVFLIAAALNYNALQHFAYHKAQVNYWLSFGVPILVDTFIAIAAFIALINREQGESTTLAKIIVVVFTLASIYLNSLHYPLTIYGLSMAALVPAVVFLAVELALQQMEIKYRRDEATITLQKLHTQMQQARQALANIEAEAAQKQAAHGAIIAAKNAEIEQQTQLLHDLAAQTKAAELQLAQAKTALAEGETCAVDWSSREANLLRLDGMLAAGVNFSHAARVLQVAPNTVRNWAKHLNGNSLSEGKVQQ